MTKDQISEWAFWALTAMVVVAVMAVTWRVSTAIDHAEISAINYQRVIQWAHDHKQDRRFGDMLDRALVDDKITYAEYDDLTTYIADQRRYHQRQQLKVVAHGS